MPLNSLRALSQTPFLSFIPRCLPASLQSRLSVTAAKNRPRFCRLPANCLGPGLSMAPPPSLEKQYMSSATAPKKAPPEPRPSASILLISPSNQILLLHRVQTSSSFPSAHVFPGGNISEKQDGEIPGPNDPRRHLDGPAYRLGAIRECFEESGILLARKNDGSGDSLEVPEEERERARKEIHDGRLRFSDWVKSQGGLVDTDSLIPFTRWITPTNIPRRFTTQMYLAFLDLPPSQFANSATSTSGNNPNVPDSSEIIIPNPTSDGGVEHTAALFDFCSSWLSQARANSIILFPPQFYLMHLLAPFLSPPSLSPASSASTSSLPPPSSIEELQKQRDAVVEFLKGDGDGHGVPWAEKVMSPLALMFRKSDGRSVLALDKPGPELKDIGRSGDYERVVLAKFSKEGPRDVEVRLRKEVLLEEKAFSEKERKVKL